MSYSSLTSRMIRKSLKPAAAVGIPTAAAGYGLYKLDEAATPKPIEQYKQANASKIDAKKHLEEHEKYKRLKGYATAGSIGMLGLTAIGGAKKNVPALVIGLPGVAALSYAAGKADRKSQYALGKLKQYYDLRDKERNMQKTAVVGGIVELTSALGAYGADLLGHGLPFHSLSDFMGHLGHAVGLAAPVMAAATPTAIDLATLPTLGKLVTENVRQHGYVGAKQTMGLPLTPQEALSRASSQAAVAKINMHKDMKPGIRKAIGQFIDKYRGPKATGGQIGEQAGAILKELHKLSPSLATASLEAIRSDAGLEALKKTLVDRKNIYTATGKVLDSTIDEVPGLRKLLLATGKGSKNYLGEALEHPEKTTALAEKIKALVQANVRGAKAFGAGAALGLGAYYLGNKRTRHTLAKDEVPMQLAQLLKKEESEKQPTSFSTAKKRST